MIGVPKQARKPSEKAASSQPIVFKTYQKNIKLKLNVGDQKPVPASKLVASKKLSKPPQALLLPSIEVSSDSEEDEDKDKDEKEDEDEEEKDVEGTNASVKVKS